MANIRIHPVFLVMLLLWALNGHIAHYFLVLVSLLWHEAGHLLLARLKGVKVGRVTMLPFGANIEFSKGQAPDFTTLIWIAAGGPLFTLLALMATPLVPVLFRQEFFFIQLALLLVNLLPIYPLDGGRILCNFLLKNNPKKEIYESYITLSFSFITILSAVLLLMLPESIFLVVLSLLLWSEVMGEWRYRKYRSAFEKVVMNRLT